MNVYKPWESFAQYWFCYYLSSHLESNLKRLHQYLEQRMAYISALGKKLKKLKAGEKKEKAKERYRNLMATEMPSLRENNRTTNYFFMICTILKSLSLAQVFQFSFLRTHGLINSRNPIPNHFCSDKLAYTRAEIQDIFLHRHPRNSDLRSIRKVLAGFCNRASVS